LLENWALGNLRQLTDGWIDYNVKLTVKLAKGQFPVRFAIVNRVKTTDWRKPEYST